MREILNNQVFGADVRPLIARVELNSGSGQIEFEKSDGSFAVLTVFDKDDLFQLPTAQGLKFRPVLAGGAKFFIGHAVR